MSQLKSKRPTASCSRKFAAADSPKPSNPGHFAVILLAALLVTGCAGRQGITLPEFASWEDRAHYLRGADDWEIIGRIGVRAGDDGFNGKLRWRQDGGGFVTTVGGPLGIGTVRIVGDAASAVVVDKDGQHTVLSDVEGDLLRRYGWTIPVTSLRYWALGIPDPGAPVASVLVEDDRLERLEQRDWVVSVSHYRDAAGQAMPYRLSVTSADTRVRIVVDTWRFFD